MVNFLLIFILFLTFISTMLFQLVLDRVELVENIEENINECIDIVDRRYYNLIHVFDDVPGVLTDDPVVKDFMDEVKGTRNDVLKIANILAAVADPLSQLGTNISDEDESHALEEKKAMPEEEEKNIVYFTEREKEAQKN